MLRLRNCGDALVDRCAAMIERRRLRRAEALLPKAVLEKAALWRALHLARNARLQRERETRRLARAASGKGGLPVQDISKADVLAAIARSRANRDARLKSAHDDREDG